MQGNSNSILEGNQEILKQSMESLSGSDYELAFSLLMEDLVPVEEEDRVLIDRLLRTDVEALDLGKIYALLPKYFPDNFEKASADPYASLSTPEMIFLKSFINPLYTETIPFIQEDVVSIEEFAAIENGMTIEEVETIIGVPGQLLSSNESVFGEQKSTMETLSWANVNKSSVDVFFQNGVVTGKSRQGLRFTDIKSGLDGTNAVERDETE